MVSISPGVTDGGTLGSLGLPAQIPAVDSISFALSYATLAAFASAFAALSSTERSAGCFSVATGIIYLALAASLAVGSFDI